jgi:hypothetical protein
MKMYIIPIYKGRPNPALSQHLKKLVLRPPQDLGGGSRLSGFGVALGSHWGGFKVALGWLYGGYPLAINTL